MTIKNESEQNSMLDSFTLGGTFPNQPFLLKCSKNYNISLYFQTKNYKKIQNKFEQL